MLKSYPVSQVTINTGNVLNLIDIKKKACQNVTEELSESIKLTLSEWSSKNSVPVVQNGTCSSDERKSDEDSDYVVLPSSTSIKGTVLNITRPLDDVETKMAEEERKNLKIGVKIFINEDKQGALRECLENVFSALKINYIDNVILAYNPEIPSNQDNLDGAHKTLHSTNASPMSLNTNIDNKLSANMDADNEADARKCEAILPGLKTLWEVLEEYVREGRVGQLGVADIGGGCLRKLYAWARARPTITQINLASCCVVPPLLQQFCKANDVQLLTHSDPPDLLSEAAIKALTEAGEACTNLDWCARYQVHIKCRGVLALKGYVCKATLVPDD